MLRSKRREKRRGTKRNEQEKKETNVFRGNRETGEFEKMKNYVENVMND